MKARDLPGFGVDFDLDGVPPGLEVVPGRSTVQADCCAASARKVQLFAKMYASRGEDALPPIVYERYADGFELLLTGAHRIEAAHAAGLDSLPAYYIIIPKVRA